MHFWTWVRPPMIYYFVTVELERRMVTTIFSHYKLLGRVIKFDAVDVVSQRIPFQILNVYSLPRSRFMP